MGDKMVFLRKKPTIVGIHGFGLRKTKEFDKLKVSLEKQGYCFKSIDLYDLNDPSDTDWTSWVSKAKSLINEASFNNDVILIGFSMGGVIASYLANEYRVKKLVLIAPAFEFLNIKTVIDQIPNFFFKSKSKLVKPPSNFTNAFMDVISNCKDSLTDIKIPTLIIHCENDEVISITSSQKNINKITNANKALVTISDGQHRLLDDSVAGPIAISNIISFIKGDFLK